LVSESVVVVTAGIACVVDAMDEGEETTVVGSEVKHTNYMFDTTKTHYKN